jgi:hypothetical protein
MMHIHVFMLLQYIGQIWFDLPLTCFLTIFLTAVILSPAMKGEIKKGTIAAVTNESLSRGTLPAFFQPCGALAL